MDNDYMSAEGAATLANRVRKYWRGRGHSVTTEIVVEKSQRIEEPDGKVRVIPSVWGVRSDMVNGLPRGMCAGANVG